MRDTEQSTGLEATSARSTTRKSTKDVDGEAAVLAAIAAMPEPDRALGLRLHSIIKASAPVLSPKLWYGMPAYARDGKVTCFFHSALRFDQNKRLRPVTGRAPWMTRARYATLGFSDAANLDEGALWPVGFAVKELTPDVEARIVALVKKAVS
jgi:uncharacterized protein YdhG (YjbR/CyaY superfamily)